MNKRKNKTIQFNGFNGENSSICNEYEDCGLWMLISDVKLKKIKHRIPNRCSLVRRKKQSSLMAQN